MKKLLTLVTFLFSFISTAQFLQSRLLKVEQKNMEKFMSAVANKTKLYNSKEGQPDILHSRFLLVLKLRILLECNMPQKLKTLIK